MGDARACRATDEIGKIATCARRLLAFLYQPYYKPLAENRLFARYGKAVFDPLKRLIAIGLAAGLLPWSGMALAETTLQETMPAVVNNQCLGCHQISRKRVGPAFVAIAKRYQEADNATEYLVTMIRSGSQGRWGAVPMPAQTHVSEAEALQIAEWLLSMDIN